jgi:hypothetical protein
MLNDLSMGLRFHGRDEEDKTRAINFTYCKIEIITNLWSSLSETVMMKSFPPAVCTRT